MGERVEALLRIPLGTLYAFISYILNVAVDIIMVVQFFYTLITGKRHRDMARFANRVASLQYHMNRYLGFATNEKPFFGGRGWEELMFCDFDKRRRSEYRSRFKEW